MFEFQNIKELTAYFVANYREDLDRLLGSKPSKKPKYSPPAGKTGAGAYSS